MRSDRARVTAAPQRVVAFLLGGVLLAGCSMFRSNPQTSPNVEGTPRAPAGFVAPLRPLASAVTGRVRVIDRNDGITVLVSAINLPPGQYRIAFHETRNCSSPNGFSVGPVWAPSSAGRAARDIAPTLRTNPDGTAEDSFFVRGVHTGGPEGVSARSVILYAGSEVTDARPDVVNNRVACGVFEPATSSFAF